MNDLKVMELLRYLLQYNMVRYREPEILVVGGWFRKQLSKEVGTIPQVFISPDGVRDGDAIYGLKIKICEHEGDCFYLGYDSYYINDIWAD